MPILLELFLSFSLIGLGAYGGGLVTIPLIQYEVSISRHWLEFSELARILAIAQMTPGPIAINAATFTGFRMKGILGAVAATVAVVTPSILILTVLVPCIERFKNNPHLRRIRKGLQIGVLSLILFAVWAYGTMIIKGALDLSIAAGAFLLLTVFNGKLNPVFVVLICGLIGLLLF